MPVRIRIRNVQSIEDATINVRGFTVVTGSNNSGKTASIRAVQGVFSNTPGDALVRHGADKLSVEVDFGGGHSVVWEKGPKTKPTYIVDGKVIHPGREVPEAVRDLGVLPIAAGSVTVWPQMAPQFTGQVFLLDMPGSALAEAVADVERVGKLTRALGFAESDKRAATSEVKLRRKDLEEARVAIADFNGLDDVGNRIQTLEDKAREALRMEGEVGALQELRESYTTRTREVGWFSGLGEVRVPSAEGVLEIQGSKKEYEEVKVLHKRREATLATLHAIEGVEGVRVPIIPQEVSEVRDRLGETMRLQSRRGEALREVLVGEAYPKGLFDQPVPEMLAKVRKAYTTLTAMRKQRREGQDLIRSLMGRLEEVGVEWEGALSEVREILGGLGECPTCGTTCGGHSS